MLQRFWRYSKLRRPAPSSFIAIAARTAPVESSPAIASRHDHWTNTKALAEARSMGMSWYQTAIQHYVRGYQPKSDGAAPTQMAGMTTPIAAAP